MNIVSKPCNLSIKEANYRTEIIDRIDQNFIGQIEKGAYSCASYLLQRKGQPFVMKSMGVLNHFKQEGQCQPDSIRYVASVTKLFTAVAIMQLIEKGKLYLKQSIADIVKEMDHPMFKDVQVLHLLTHTSGLAPDKGTYGEPFQRLNDKSKNWFENTFAGLPVAKPGERWSYSSDCFCLLGKIIENLSGMDYDTYVIKNIIEPLGLKRTFFYVPEALKSEMVMVHEWEKEILDYKREDEEHHFTLAGGDLISCLEDMAIFGQMILNDGHYNGKQILSRKSVEAMSRNYVDKDIPNYCWENDGTEKPYGLGIDLDTQNCLFDEGLLHQGAGRCGLFIDKKEDFIVIYFQPMLTEEWDWQGSLGLRNIIWSGLK